MLSSYFFPLVARREIASGTIEFTLDVSGSDFVFRAGQWVDVTLVNPPFTDEGGNTRTLSFVNAPGENGERLVFALRTGKSAYKRSLMALPIGAQIKVSRASGLFVLRDDVTRPIVFLIGGIGITPARSMIAGVVARGEQRKLFLFYSNRTPSEAAYLEDFVRWATMIDLKFIPTITDSGDPTWKYERGRIGASMLERNLLGVLRPLFYIAGPPDMVLSAWQMLHMMGVADEDITTEEFSGY